MPSEYQPTIHIEILFDPKTLGELAINAGIATSGTDLRQAAEALVGGPLPAELEHNVQLVTGGPLSLTSVSTAAVHGLASNDMYDGFQFAIQIAGTGSGPCSLKNLQCGLTRLIANVTNDHFRDLGISAPPFGVLIEIGEEISRFPIEPKTLEASR